MTDLTERRINPRLAGHGLVMMIGRRVFPIANISITGLGFQGSGYRENEVLTVQIARINALEDCVPAVITVRSVQETMVRGEFHPTLPLMRYIIAHLSEVTGADPTYPGFRRETTAKTDSNPS